MQSENNFLSSLARVRGLGSARSGVGHYIHQRLTAIFLIPLVIWISSLIIKLSTLDYEQVLKILASPLNSIGLILFFITAIYHGILGIKVIIEDYVHCECFKNGLLICLYAISFLSLTVGVVSIISIHIKHFLLG